MAEELVQRLDTKTGSAATIIDLGCGTGLVGQELASRLSPRPKLTGVDLSPRMVDIARVRTKDDQRIYEKVVQADAESFFKDLDEESVDAVVSADVFIYIGELEGVFSAISKVLTGPRLLIFSVETTPKGMTLLPSGRFGHSEEYIKDLAQRTGFDFVLWREGALRQQHGAPVSGAVVVLQKKN